MAEDKPYIAFRRDRARKLSYNAAGALVEEVGPETIHMPVAGSLLRADGVQAVRMQGWNFIVGYDFKGLDKVKTADGSKNDYAKLAEYLEQEYATELAAGRVALNEQRAREAAAKAEAEEARLMAMAEKIAAKMVEQKTTKPEQKDEPIRTAEGSAGNSRARSEKNTREAGPAA